MSTSSLSTPNLSPDLSAWSKTVQQHIEATLGQVLPHSHLLPHTRLTQAMHYAVLGGGKRVRPLLVFAVGELVNAPWERLQYAACAVELIHAYSLIHDDLPCMDNDNLRHGKPTVHIQFDEATALLAGDALQTAAFEVLTSHVLCDQPDDQLKMIQLLATASGANGMAGGQAIDLAAVGKPLSIEELKQMHRMKTGSLIRAAVLLGSYCGTTLSASAREKLDRFAQCIGLAFQVVDDILDVEADTHTLGKTTGKDAKEAKPTFVSLLGLTEAKQYATSLEAEALNLLTDWLPPAEQATENGQAAKLAYLTQYIVHRSF